MIKFGKRLLARQLFKKNDSRGETLPGDTAVAINSSFIWSLWARINTEGLVKSLIRAKVSVTLLIVGQTRH